MNDVDRRAGLTQDTGAGYYTMWAYSNIPDQTIPSQTKSLKAFFSLSLVANAMATCKFLTLERFDIVSWCNI